MIQNVSEFYEENYEMLLSDLKKARKYENHIFMVEYFDFDKMSVFLQLIYNHIIPIKIPKTGFFFFFFGLFSFSVQLDKLVLKCV